MAIVDVIDLTVSSPSVICIDDDIVTPNRTPPHEKDVFNEERKKKKKRQMERDRPQRRRAEQVERKHDDTWKHDKFLDGDGPHRGDKRKLDDRESSRKSKRRERSPDPRQFLIDTTGGEVLIPFTPPKNVFNDEASLEPAPNTILELEPTPIEKGLLLPAHVTVSAQEPKSVLHEVPPMSPISEASGIDFLDDDCAVGAARYFQDTEANAKSRSRGPCKKCGDSDHDLKSCPNMICLTCGARNEHSSRSCPVLRFCWNCKAKGHIAKDCPRIGDLDQQKLNRQDCERCGSWKHHGTNCPTLWRIYAYLTDDERDAVLAAREARHHLGFGSGGEGYIARDRWCYNCGGPGHLGDDCEAAPPNHDRPNDFSAFGSLNELTGPFASSSAVPIIERAPREWEEGGRFDDGFGFSAQDNVGKKGRENAKAKARERQLLLDEEDNEPDWFNTNRARSTNDKPRLNAPSSKGKPNKLPPSTIHFLPRDPDSSTTQLKSTPSSGAPQPPRPLLVDRIDTGDRRGLDYLHRDRAERKGQGRDRRRDERRRDERRRDERRRDDQRRDDRRRDERQSWDQSGTRDTVVYSSRGESSKEHGSRWRGGYGR